MEIYCSDFKMLHLLAKDMEVLRVALMFETVIHTNASWVTVANDGKGNIKNLFAVVQTHKSRLSTIERL